MLKGRAWILAGICWLTVFAGRAQRNYAPHSVLATGDWYRFSVTGNGVCKLDLAFLSSLGIPAANLASASVRIFSGSPGMLPEANNAPYLDDLQELSVLLVDGGDGLLSGQDYILFYAPGPDDWLRDSLQQRFRHRKNLYSRQRYYFITIGGNGKRIQQQAGPGPAVVTRDYYQYRYFHELDTVNLLSGGKEWFGEEFASAPGKTLNRSFSLPVPHLISTEPLQIYTACLARSAGNASRFDIRLDNSPAQSLLVNPVSGGIYDIQAREATIRFAALAASGSPQLHYSFTPGSFNAQGWLNWLEITARCRLSMEGLTQLSFRDWSVVGNSRVEYRISQAPADLRVWDVTDPFQPIGLTGSFSGNEYRVTQTAERLREFIAFSSGVFLQPVKEGKTANQDLHLAAPADYVIITHPSLLSQAARVADFHRVKNRLRVTVVTTEQVYNEFSGGSPDPVALRDFIKMYYDKYGNDPASRLRYLLLFGDASFDYLGRIPNNSNLVPAWQTLQSLDPLNTYTSDDFFGFLDNQEDINSGLVSNYLDIGIGRIPAGNQTEATHFADKLIAYHAAESQGAWRNNLCFIADDEDGNLHLQDAEIITSTAAGTAPAFNQQKIYLDAYKQESGAGGSRYPDANLAVNNQVASGTLIWNYNGHGGSSRLAEETILDAAIVNSWDNPNRLPLFITATCDFAPYDNPVLASIGENLLLRPRTGAIALMTTTRPVFAFSNRVMNTNYLQYALQKKADSSYRTLGEAVREAKNFTYQNLPDIANNRKFTLLGDPAMSLAFPREQAGIISVNGQPAGTADTLRAGEEVILDGEIKDQQGNRLTDFNGYVYPVFYDKPVSLTTLGNDPGSQPAPFRVQQSVLFRGKFTVSSGLFRIRFRMPKDIDYRFDRARLSLYASNGDKDAQGLDTRLLVGGTGIMDGNDKEGPEIRAWMNDESFVNGGLCNQEPVLLLKLSDSSGINTTGIGVGHDLVATLDGDNNRYFLLNDFYEAETDNYRQGRVRFRLPALEPGPHSLAIKAWDLVNNSGEYILHFTVADDGELEIKRVLNYPNPFNRYTRFWFEHNKPGEMLGYQLQIMTVTGRVIRNLAGTLPPGGNRSTEIEWDGRDDYGDRPGRGVYIYKLRVISANKQVKEVLGKMVLL